MQNLQSQKVKAYQLREKSEDMLEKDLKQLKTELVTLRTSQVSSAPQVKLARIRVRIPPIRFYPTLPAISSNYDHPWNSTAEVC